MEYITIIISILILSIIINYYLAGYIYDFVIAQMNSTWYEAFIEKQKPNARILDVGIGTCKSLAMNKDQVIEKNLNFIGVDYDQVYVKYGKEVIKKSGLQNNVTLYCRSVYEKGLAHELGANYDAGYFSASFSLMPNPILALNIVASMLKDDGLIYITQTFQRKQIAGLYYLKPLLKYLTTIDFGNLIYEQELYALLKQSNMKIVSNEIIQKSINNRFQAARLLVLDPNQPFEEQGHSLTLEESTNT